MTDDAVIDLVGPHFDKIYSTVTMREAFSTGATGVIDVIADALPHGSSAGRRQMTIALYGLMAGTPHKHAV